MDAHAPRRRARRRPARCARGRPGTPPAAAARPAVPASSTRASSINSGGSESPAGEAVPRLPPSVPRLRIWGEPTVREAAASAGRAGATARRRGLRVGQRGAQHAARRRLAASRAAPARARGRAAPRRSRSLNATMRSVPPAIGRARGHRLAGAVPPRAGAARSTSTPTHTRRDCWPHEGPCGSPTDGRRSRPCARAAACGRCVRAARGPRRGSTGGGSPARPQRAAPRSARIEQQQVGDRPGSSSRPAAAGAAPGRRSRGRPVSLLVRPSASRHPGRRLAAEMSPPAANAWPS